MMTSSYNELWKLNPTWVRLISERPAYVFTNHSQEHSLSFSPKFGKFECNTTSDWLNHTV